ncbi:MAG TPA: four-helix bundle copper-binding protein [Burkholderiaceae bacterium]|nr:four-helix bundle copper-binding protein [Burkholderiaceae bacterium]
MALQQFQSCVEACQRCALACDHCAASCLQETDPKAMARCIALDIDCAEICRLATAAMARDSEFAAAICATCAEICDECGDECARHQASHCQECAQACRTCADECRRTRHKFPHTLHRWHLQIRCRAP